NDGPFAIVILVEGSVTANGQTLNKPGQALIFSKGGVQLVNWDSTLFSVVGGTWSFPLFGNHWRMEAPDWAKQDFDQDRIEQLLGGGPGPGQQSYCFGSGCYGH